MLLLHGIVSRSKWLGKHDWSWLAQGRNGVFCSIHRGNTSNGGSILIMKSCELLGHESFACLIFIPKGIVASNLRHQNCSPLLLLLSQLHEQVIAKNLVWALLQNWRTKNLLVMHGRDSSGNALGTDTKGWVHLELRRRPWNLCLRRCRDIIYGRDLPKKYPLIVQLLGLLGSQRWQLVIVGQLSFSISLNTLQVIVDMKLIWWCHILVLPWLLLLLLLWI